ncbi:FAD-dependent oxidoreductase [Rhodobacteraceae bacterium B1Z28]|uniref:FAD-dependent oxidoreductase n=1 Tax=Ruegeria haliotis TaxID=2747601 RepID=A0ABX2PTC6_9RHOB|nr:FAD-dependent oxidoreductase [Ruegeria haliotis]NVO57435.1 FAD-dependent oxidoreductase [Ruegeria haliotis]
MSFAEKALKDVTFFPFWLDSQDAPDVCHQLIGQTDADLLIIGGGFTGLWAAIQAKEQNPGRDVVLIEAGKVAYGASGRPGAIVSTSLMHGLHNAIRIFPEDIAVLEQLGQDNMRGFLKTLEDHNIDAQQEWGGELTVGIGDGSYDVVKEEYEVHAKYGHDVELLDRDAVRAQVDSPLYTGGCWSKALSGTVHPARLAWGLKQAALSLGVRLHEHTLMENIERIDGVLHVKTHDGLIKTPKILLCTNAFAAGHKNIKKRVVGIRDRVMATEPLTDEQMDRVGWKNRQGIYDTRTQLNYTRLTKDNRIIFGGRLTYYYDGTNNTDPAYERTQEPYELLAEKFNDYFPQLDDVKISHAWSGPIALTTRMAVHFQTYWDGDVVWAGGYSGFGVSTSRFGARVGLAKLDRVDLPELNMDLSTTMPNWVPPEPFRWIGSKITFNALDSVDEKGGWRRAWVSLVQKLGFPI